MSGVNPSDKDLIAAARAGDKAAFGALAERHLPTARQTALYMLGDADLALTRYHLLCYCESAQWQTNA